MAYCMNCIARLIYFQSVSSSTLQLKSSKCCPLWFRFQALVLFQRFFFQLAYKHLSKSFENDNGTCNSNAINVCTYLLSHYFASSASRKKLISSTRFLSFSLTASSDFLCSKLFLNGKGQCIKLKIALTQKTASEAHYSERWFQQSVTTCKILTNRGAERIKWFLFMSYAKSLFHSSRSFFSCLI